MRERLFHRSHPIKTTLTDIAPFSFRHFSSRLTARNDQFVLHRYCRVNFASTPFRTHRRVHVRRGWRGRRRRRLN